MVKLSLKPLIRTKGDYDSYFEFDRETVLEMYVEMKDLPLPSPAHMVQGYLESEGIDTMLKYELKNKVNNLYFNALGGLTFALNVEKNGNIEDETNSNNNWFTLWISLWHSHPF